MKGFHFNRLLTLITARFNSNSHSKAMSQSKLPATEFADWEITLKVPINLQLTFHSYYRGMPAPVAPIDYLGYEVIHLLHQVHDLYCLRLDKAKADLVKAEAEPDSPRDPLGMRENPYGKKHHVSNAQNYVESIKKTVSNTEWAFRKALAVYSELTNMFLVEAPGSGNCFTSLMSYVSQILLIYCDDQAKLTNDLMVKVSYLIAFNHSNRLLEGDPWKSSDRVNAVRKYYADKKKRYEMAEIPTVLRSCPSYENRESRLAKQEMGSTPCKDLLDLSVFE